MTLSDRINAVITELVANGIPLVQAMDQLERRYILAALIFCSGNVTRAAVRLGMHRNSIHGKMRALQIANVRPAKYRARNRAR